MTNLTRYGRVLAACALLAAPVVLQAAETEQPWQMSFFAGRSFDLEGKLRPSLRYDDAFDTQYRFGTQLSYRYSPALEGFAGVAYDNYDGKSTGIELLPGASVQSHFDDTSAWTVSLGGRYHFLPDRMAAPFVGLGVGVTRMDPIRSSVEIPGTSVDVANLDFTRRSNLFSQTAEVGLDFNISPKVALQFAVAANHLDAPRDSTDAGIAQLGLGSDGARSQWSFPALLAATYRF